MSSQHKRKFFNKKDKKFDKQCFDRNQHKTRFERNNSKSILHPGGFDLEKARQEVFMLGLKGFIHKDKQEAKRDLAIRLGAIPKKPKGKNIKRHMEEVRERKQQQQKENSVLSDKRQIRIKRHTKTNHQKKKTSKSSSSKDLRAKKIKSV